jgi:PAS domain S-box-containing protein
MQEKTKTAGEFTFPAQEIHSKDPFSESLILNLLPTGVYVCDLSGIIKNFNEQAAKLWGKRPLKGDNGERFSGAYKIYSTDGTYLPYDETPVAKCLKDGLPRNNVELILKRPDLTRIVVREQVTPLKNADGDLVGAIASFADITHQWEQERLLTAKVFELEDYVNNANVGLHWVDANGLIKWANEAELKLLGYTAEEYIGRHISDFHVDKEKIDDILRRLGRNETLSQYESQLRCKDGSIKTVHINSSAYREDDRFIHSRCFTIDVTQQINLFAALKESEARYRELIQSLQTPLYTTDVEGRIMLFNKAAADLWGREPEIGKDLWCGSYRIKKVDGAPLPLDSCPMAICLKEKRPVYNEEILVIRPDGTLRHVAPHPHPIYDTAGNMTGAINMLIDVTDIKRVENALRESEIKYRNLADSLEQKVIEKTKDLTIKTEQLEKSEERYHKMIEEVEDYAIILLDRYGIIQKWNKGAEKIKGYSEAEIIGKSFEEFYLPEDRETGLPFRILDEATEKGKAIHEGWKKKKDGSTFWGYSVLTALHDDNDDIIGFSKVTRDVTKTKLAEDRSKEYLSQLEFKNKELEQFTYAASHDMKEPLRKIHLYNGFIAEHPANQLDSKSRDYLNRSIRAVERMKNLIEDLLSYSRVTSNSEGYAFTDLKNVVDEVLSDQKEEIEAKKIVIETDKLPVINAIPFQIKQLISNLVENAIKYRHPERNAIIRLSGKLVRGSEISGYQAEANAIYHKISVEDNGVGFEPQYAQKIFEIFQRLNNGAGTKGSGIGLAICKRIVQNHNGYIQATGKANEGAGFHIYIPKARSFSSTKGQ